MTSQSQFKRAREIKGKKCLEGLKQGRSQKKIERGAKFCNF